MLKCRGTGLATSFSLTAGRCSASLSDGRRPVTPLQSLQHLLQEIENEFRQVSVVPLVSKILQQHQMKLDRPDTSINNWLRIFTVLWTVLYLHLQLPRKIDIAQQTTKQMVNTESMYFTWTSEKTLTCLFMGPSSSLNVKTVSGWGRNIYFAARSQQVNLCGIIGKKIS